jgi:hypothetical protein
MVSSGDFSSARWGRRLFRIPLDVLSIDGNFPPSVHHAQMKLASSDARKATTDADLPVQARRAGSAGYAGRAPLPSARCPESGNPAPLRSTYPQVRTRLSTPW